MIQAKENDCLEIIELLLEHWGNWVFNGNRTNLGYSHLSNIGAIMESGGMYIKVIGKKPLEEDPRAQEMEDLIIELTHRYPKEAEAVKLYYGKRISKFIVADKLKISYRTLNDRLRAAKIWLDGRIAKEHVNKK